MKASEFIKQYGWDLSKYPVGHHQYVSIDELRKYIDAYELVQSCGGLEKAELKVRLQRASGLIPHAERTEKAIKLVDEVGGCQQ